MTIRDLFIVLGDHSILVLAFFLLVPLTAWLAGIMGKNEGHETPWKQLYAVLVYLACVPGIAAITLNLYQFLFSRSNVLDMDLFVQVVPIVSMIATLLLIRQSVDFRYIPGFRKLSGLCLMIFVTFALMWGLDRTRIFAFTYLPFQYLIFIFIGLFALLYFGWTRLTGAPER